MSVTRRNVLLGGSALMAVGALAGCGGDDSETIVVSGDSGGEITISADEKTYVGAMGNNCGGRCVVKAHVRNGVIKRFSSDERPDQLFFEGSENNPQLRACLRCRGKRTLLYRNDRMIYPLKQTLERGNPGGFVRISWKQAFDEIAEKFKEIIAEAYPGTDDYYKNLPAGAWGKCTLQQSPGSGPTFSLPDTMVTVPDALMRVLGSSVERRTSGPSYPGMEHVMRFMMNGSTAVFNMEANKREDLFNCDHIVLWGFNPGDSIQGTNTAYMLIHARDKGIPITVLDPHLTRISTMLGASRKTDSKVRHLAPIGGTDTALVCALLYHLLEMQMADDVTAGYHTKKYLDYDYIDKTVHGFFDKPAPTAADFHAWQDDSSLPYTSDGINLDTICTPNAPTVIRQPKDAPSEYAVPVGGSFSAYIFGSDTRLVSAGLNQGTSIYPATIGYNVNSAAQSPTGAADDLYAVRMPIYGQVAKTPEWAEMVTGIKAADIRWFAEMFAQENVRGEKQRVGMFTGWGSNRTNENEQAPWSIAIFAAIMGCYGENGRFFGQPHYYENYSVLAPGGALPGLDAAHLAAAEEMDTYVNHRRYNKNKVSFTNANWRSITTYGKWGYYTCNTYQQAAQQDLFSNGGSGKSFWNNPEVKFCPPIRGTVQLGGNFWVTQAANAKKNTEILKERDLVKDPTGNTYKLRLAVNIDPFMTPSSQHADYVLPPALPFETESFVTNVYGGASLHWSPAAITPPGEAIHEMYICEGILRSFGGTEKAKQISGLKSLGQLTKDGWDILTQTPDFQARYAGMTFNEFKEQGVLSFLPDRSDNLVNPEYASFRNFVNGAGGAPLTTASGKFEAYCQSMVEDYEARRWYNFDDLALDFSRYSGYSASDFELILNNGSKGIYTKSCQYINNEADIPTTPGYDPDTTLITGTQAQMEANMKRARFVYPIPMYIPIIEGRHDCDDKAQADYGTGYPSIETVCWADPEGLALTYPYCVGNYHSILRGHSTNDNNAYVNETFKRDFNGNPAHASMTRGTGNVQDGTGIYPSDLGVYEPVYMNPIDAADMGLKFGDIVMAESKRGKILLSVHTTKTTRKGIMRIAEGAWTTFRNCDISFEDTGVAERHNVDVSGSVNSISMGLPSRICQGSSYGSYQRVSIRKIVAIKLAE